MNDDPMKRLADLASSPSMRLLAELHNVPSAPKAPEPEQKAKEPEKEERDPTKKEQKYRPPEPSRENQPSVGPGFKSGGGKLTLAQKEALEKRAQEREAASTLEQQRRADPDLLMEARRRVAEKHRTQEPLPLHPKQDKGREYHPPGFGRDDGKGR